MNYLTKPVGINQQACVVSTELLLESGSKLLIMTGENPILNSSDRGSNAGKETLTYGEYICPLHLDYVDGSPSDVQMHCVSAHEDYPSEERVREVSKKFRDQPLPGAQDQPTQETLTNTSDSSEDEKEDTTEDTVLNEVYDEDVDPEELDSEIQDTLDSLDTVKEVEKSENENNSGLISWIKSLFGL